MNAATSWRRRSSIAPDLPQPGWVEHDPLEIWRTQLATARDALAKAGIAANACGRWASPTSAKPRCCGTARPASPCTTPSCGKTGAPNPPAPSCEGEQGHAATIQAKTGLLVDAYSPAPSCSGCWTTCPAPANAAERGELAFGTVDSWLMWKLTHGQVHVTDVSNAARTMLFNVHTNQWDDELLALLRIPKALLPEVLPSAATLATQPPTCWAIPSASAAWRATSKARCSAKPASRRAWPRTPMAPAASC